MRQQAVLYGTVVRGERRGRTLGYPTANLDQQYFRSNPQPKGVYAARAWVDAVEHDALAVVGVPGPKHPHGKIEVHLLDFHGNLYGKDIAAALIRRMRPLFWYKNNANLQRRIRMDIRESRGLIAAFEREEQRKIAAIRQGADMLARIVRTLPRLLRAGRAERGIRDDLLELIGPSQPSFPPIVATGHSAAFMHHIPTRTKIKQGDMVVVDFGVTVNGFCTDLTRTFFIGTPRDRERKRYSYLLASQQRGLTAVRPFVPAALVDRAVRNSLKRVGLHRAFIHSSGHGVGRRIHERPSLGERSHDLLLPGHIVTVEPGIYFKGWGGMRVEDMALVTKEGSEALTKRIPKQLKDVIL